MKIQIVIDDSLEEEEVLIKCPRISEDVMTLEQMIREIDNKHTRLLFYDGDKEYYLTLDEILFFETEDNHVTAHAADASYQVHYRLYELEEMLPGYFVRISKSTIMNIHHVHAINKNLTGASEVEFNNTYKRVYVSRSFYKGLKERLDDRRYSK